MNFIDHAIVTQHAIPIIPLPEPKTVSAVDGKFLARITHQTAPVTLLTSGNHCEHFQFFVITSLHSPFILNNHNPHIDWIKRHYH